MFTEDDGKLETQMVSRVPFAVVNRFGTEGILFRLQVTLSLLLPDFVGVNGVRVATEGVSLLSREVEIPVLILIIIFREIIEVVRGVFMVFHVQIVEGSVFIGDFMGVSVSADVHVIFTG